MQIQFGTNTVTGQPLYWLPNDTNQVFHTNTGIIGTMGTGKTQFTKSLITQLYRDQDHNVGDEPLGILIFDYKGDYNESKEDFVKATNAKILKPYHLPFNPLALTKSVVFFEDKGLTRSQQIFTDLNKHAVKTSNSISELYDSRDDLAVVTRKVVSSVKFINTFTDKEKDNLGKFSSNLFALNMFYKANKKIIQRMNVDAGCEKFLIEFWTCVSENIVQWNELLNKEISKVDLRENYIITQAVVIQALGRVGNYFFMHQKSDMHAILKRLQNIDWKRTSPQWHLRTIRANGRMISSETAVVLTANVIKKSLGIELDEDEKMKEQKFLNR